MNPLLLFLVALGLMVTAAVTESSFLLALCIFFLILGHIGLPIIGLVWLAKIALRLASRCIPVRVKPPSP